MAAQPRKPTGSARRVPVTKRPDERAEATILGDTPEDLASAPVEVTYKQSTSFKEQTMATKTALVIGIDDYGGPPNSLSCCLKDADDLARVLQHTYGFDEVSSLRDNDVTVDRVDAELRRLFKGRKGDDRVVFYFSGHGFTRAKNGVVEDCLVLRDGLFDSERFLATAAELPPAICTVVLDASFTGPLEQFVADGSRGIPEVEIARAKVWHPTSEHATRFGISEGHQKVSEFRRFACRSISSPNAIAGAFAARAQSYVALGAGRSGAWSRGAALGASEENEGQLALSAVLLCAGLETESAAASTSRTEGHSAFTYALIGAMRQLGPQASTAEIAAATQARLRALGFRQTPRIMEQTAMGDLKLRRFLTLEPITAAETLRIMSEPRYWESVLAAATPPLSSAWAASQETNQMTMQQPLTGAYQPTIGAYPQPFASAQFGTDVSALGPALATVIPALVPQIVNSVLAQQRFLPTAGYAPGLTPSFVPPTPLGYSGLTPFGSQPHQFASVDDVQRILPSLTPILSAVIPAIVPQIVNNILSQQRMMSNPWTAPYGSLESWQPGPIGFQNAPHAFASPFGRIY